MQHIKMKYPNFFDTIPTIKLQDKLSKFLGTFDDGIVEFSYLDIVKNSGHSCPTVAGAYLMCLVGLKELYPKTIPKRGEIKVFFKEDKLEGVAGVIASVVTHITGATEDLGFKGMNGNFLRTGLMKFQENISSSIKLQRVDTGASIEILYDPSLIKADPKIMQFMGTKEFGNLWQKRVEDIFNNIDKVIKVI